MRCHRHSSGFGASCPARRRCSSSSCKRERARCPSVMQYNVRALWYGTACARETSEVLVITGQAPWLACGGHADALCVDEADDGACTLQRRIQLGPLSQNSWSFHKLEPSEYGRVWALAAGEQRHGPCMYAIDPQAGTTVRVVDPSDGYSFRGFCCHASSPQARVCLSSLCETTGPNPPATRAPIASTSSTGRASAQGLQSDVGTVCVGGSVCVQTREVCLLHMLFRSPGERSRFMQCHV